MSRPAPPRTSGSCFYCNQKRVSCSATKVNGSYPCQRCIDKDQDLTLCGPHLDDPRWIPGVSGATHARVSQKTGHVSKVTTTNKVKKPASKKAAPKGVTTTASRPVRSSRKTAQVPAIDEPSGEHDQTENEQSDNDVSDDGKEDTVTSRFKKYVKEETDRTGVNPLHTLWQKTTDEWKAVQRMTLGEMRLARAEERPLMSQDGRLRLFSPPPGPDDAVFGDLMGGVVTTGQTVPTKPQQLEDEDY
ncbi:hypothetical protein Slin14017_G086260 [Septoria linicola]|nr:hypothetical protein Slin14017_G086260 [Septoria linicola]